MNAITAGTRRLADRAFEAWHRRPAATRRRQAVVDALATLAATSPNRTGFYVDELEEATGRSAGTLYADLAWLERVDGRVTSEWFDGPEWIGYPKHLRRKYSLAEPERQNP